MLLGILLSETGMFSALYKPVYRSLKMAQPCVLFIILPKIIGCEHAVEIKPDLNDVFPLMNIVSHYYCVLKYIPKNDTVWKFKINKENLESPLSCFVFNIWSHRTEWPFYIIVEKFK